MKAKLQLLFIVLVFIADVCQVAAQGTAFTYQGRLNSGGAPANGTYDLSFTLFDASTNGNVIAGPLVIPATPVSNGLFTVTMDFGASFPGANRWLEIGVRTNGGGAFTTLEPRQLLTSTPYAITANSAAVAAVAGLANSVANGSITSNSLAPGAVTAKDLGPGAAVANLAGSSQTAVPSGGIVLTAGGVATQNLENAGYVKIAEVTLNPESWNTNFTAGPGDTGELIAARLGHTAVWTGTEMIIWGGEDAHLTEFGVFSQLHNNGAIFNPTANSWTIVNPNSGLDARMNHVAVWTGSLMLIWGGNDGGTNGVTNGACYNPATDTWTPMSNVNAPSPRFNPAAVWTGAKMIVWGGGSNDSGGNYSFDVPTGGLYDPAANTWTKVSTTGAPPYSMYQSVVWTGSQMLVFSSSFYQPGEAGGRYNPANNTWSALNTNGSPGSVAGQSTIWTGTNMIVWGGENLDNFDLLGTGASYNPVANTWTAISTTGAPGARYNHSAVWTGNGGKMIIWGGAILDGADYGDGAMYDPGANSWTAVATNAAPALRDSQTAVWTGSEMLIWGGEQFQSTALGDYYTYPEPGGIFSPNFNLWFNMSDAPGTGEPGARQSATAVWTGSEMLVWGGENSGFSLRTGGVYNPTSDSWSGIPTNNAPTGRQGHTAVWTGTNMVVWGGSDTAGAEGSGGRYDPVMNSWQSVSMVNAPAARSRHVAVWDGAEMLVWGGGQGGLLNPFPPVGGRYNPATDTWKVMSTTNQPTPTCLAAAVWTGQEMVVWGGVQPFLSTTTYFATGGRYNPVSDSWVLMSTNNAPSARALHTAVWSGTDYIVFGGTNAVTNLNTGARYTVATDTWTPLPAPPINVQPVSGHTAVWTGNQMIIFGGVAFPGTYNPYTSYGAIYDPSANAWTPTMESPLPSVANHCALWIDTGMLVWGGLTDIGYVDQPALYIPQRTMNLLLRP